MPSVLFVCTGNLYRSPLAAAFFLHKLKQNGESTGWRVESAGTWTIPGQSAPADLLEAAANLGVEIKGHVSRLVDRESLQESDLILVMEKGHKEALGIEFPFVADKVFLLSEVADSKAYDIADPVVSELGVEDVAQEISKLIERGFPRIIELAQSLHNSRA